MCGSCSSPEPWSQLASSSCARSTSTAIPHRGRAKWGCGHRAVVHQLRKISCVVAFSRDDARTDAYAGRGVRRSARIVAGWITIFGRVPLFYYIAHIYVLHASAILFAWITIGGAGFAASHKPDGYGFGLAGIYTVWVAVVILLYPLCRWFAAIKRRRTEWWWSIFNPCRPTNAITLNQMLRREPEGNWSTCTFHSSIRTQPTVRPTKRTKHLNRGRPHTALLIFLPTFTDSPNGHRGQAAVLARM